MMFFVSIVKNYQIRYCCQLKIIKNHFIQFWMICKSIEAYCYYWGGCVTLRCTHSRQLLCAGKISAFFGDEWCCLSKVINASVITYLFYVIDIKIFLLAATVVMRALFPRWRCSRPIRTSKMLQPSNRLVTDDSDLARIGHTLGFCWLFFPYLHWFHSILIMLDLVRHLDMWNHFVDCSTESGKVFAC